MFHWPNAAISREIKTIPSTRANASMSAFEWTKEVAPGDYFCQVRFL
jgi:hypothetical protein